MITSEFVLPNILDHLSENEKQLVTFVQPNFGDGNLIEINGIDSPKSPSATVLRVRRIILTGATAIPFHVHETKEKVYFLSNYSAIHFFLCIDGIVSKYLLEYPEHPLIVRPKTPHAIYFAGGENVFNNEVKLMVVSSSQNDNDILWQIGLKDLLTNKHRKAV